MKHNYWLYIIIFIVIELVLLFVYDSIFHKTSELISMLIFFPTYIIVDYIYHKMEGKDNSIVKTLSRMATIISVLLTTGIIGIPFYVIFSLVESKWENLGWLLFAYLIGLLYVFFSMLLNSVVNNSKISEEIQNIFKDF